MATPTYPGVYIEEIASGVRPIQSAGTSTAAFIGITEKGDPAETVKVFNFTEYQNLYGGFLANSFLSHSIYQFFNNGGVQCYIVRVMNLTIDGNDATPASLTANTPLNDRSGTAPDSGKPILTISASSPGAWGNQLGIAIADGTSDPGNEFNLLVFRTDPAVPSDQASATLLERFDNLSIVPGSLNFVESITAASKQIRVVVDQSNKTTQAGNSRGAAAPQPLDVPGQTKFRININGDGHQKVDLQDAVNAGKVADLNTADHIAGAIKFAVSQLQPLRAPTAQDAFKLFDCTLDNGVLLLTSGTTGDTSSVMVAPANDRNQDAATLLKLGRSNGGIESTGAAVRRPQPTSAGLVILLQAGSDGDPVTNDQPYIQALQSLNSLDDVSLIAIPGISSDALVGAGMNYCANRSLSDCFFIADMPQADDTVSAAQGFVATISPQNSYGAVYTPWIKMLDPTGRSSEPILVPPSGFVAGIYARTDAQRGVWKAPAGTAAALGGASGLAANFTDVQQGNLNPKNINCLRQFTGAGIVLWGARTLASDPEYGYIPVRRMAIFLRVSIYRGIQWAVFEPNDEPLWSQLRLNIRSFMMGLYRRGAFQGAAPSQAFFVKCDGETTTQDDINLGIVNVLIGFAPLKPAEFVMVKISQMAGQTA